MEMKVFNTTKSTWEMPPQEPFDDQKEFPTTVEGFTLYRDDAEELTLFDSFPDDLEHEEEFIEADDDHEHLASEHEMFDEEAAETTAPIIRMGRHTPLSRDEEVRLFSLKNHLEQEMDWLAKEMEQYLNRPKIHEASRPKSRRAKSVSKSHGSDTAERDASRALDDLAQKIIACSQQLQDVKEGIVRSNLRLVLYIARSYVGLGLPFGDLVQEGSIGLMRAVDKFDHTKGHRFSTYSVWWIRQSIRRALSDQARTIRIPSYIQESIGRIGDQQIYPGERPSPLSRGDGGKARQTAGDRPQGNAGGQRRGFS